MLGSTRAASSPRGTTWRATVSVGTHCPTASRRPSHGGRAPRTHGCACVVYVYHRLVNKTLSYAVTGPDRERLASVFADPAIPGPVRVQTEKGVIELPAPAAAAVRHLLVELASGAAVHVLADDAELTTQAAADLLGISRTYVVRLVDQGKLPAHLVGTHRRLRAADVLAYQARRTARLEAAAAITEGDRAAGVPYR